MVSYNEVNIPNVLNDYYINIADNLHSSTQNPQKLNWTEFNYMPKLSPFLKEVKTQTPITM